MDNQKQASKTGLWGMFPSVEAFLDFKKNAPVIAHQAVPKLIRFAWREGLIYAEGEKDLIELIEDSSSEFHAYERAPLTGFAFSDLIQELTNRDRQNNSVNTLLSWLNKIAEQFGFSTIQGSMVMRLKNDFNPNTSTKKNCLRILAFWLCKTYPHRGLNYEHLLKFPRVTPDTVITQIQEGVRIAFHLEGRGSGVIGPDAVRWLRDELNICIKDLNLYYLNQRSMLYSATSAVLDIGKKKGHPGEPVLYNQAIRDALALAHQMTVRWALCDYSRQQQHIVIAIAAGEFVTLEHYVQALLKAQLREYPTIRLTHFARLCARLADVKVVFAEKPYELTMIGGNILTVWAVDCFWSHTYYDFVPRLLEADMLPHTIESCEAFKDALNYPDKGIYGRFKALTAIRQSPKNIILILEIAKVCAARRMFHEANSILTAILGLYPFHIVARTFRIHLFLNLALEQSDFGMFKLYSRRALTEGGYVTENCKIEDEEFYCELALVYLGTALKILTVLRGLAPKTDDEAALTPDMVLDNLCLAEENFWKGTATAPAGMANRSSFWLLQIRALRKLLTSDKTLKRSDRPLCDRQQIYETEVMKFYAFLGWLNVDFSGAPVDNETARQIERALLDRLFSAVKTYDNSVLLRTYSPCANFSFASLILDFSPKLTVGLLKQVMRWLEKARLQVELLAQGTEGVYGIINCLIQVQPPKEFLIYINKCIETVQSAFKEELLMQDDNSVVDKSKLGGRKLILMHLEEWVKAGDMLKNDDEKSASFILP